MRKFTKTNTSNDFVVGQRLNLAPSAAKFAYFFLNGQRGGHKLANRRRRRKRKKTKKGREASRHRTATTIATTT